MQMYADFLLSASSLFFLQTFGLLKLQADNSKLFKIHETFIKFASVDLSPQALLLFLLQHHWNMADICQGYIGRDVCSMTDYSPASLLWFSLASYKVDSITMWSRELQCNSSLSDFSCWIDSLHGPLGVEQVP